MRSSRVAYSLGVRYTRHVMKTNDCLLTADTTRENFLFSRHHVLTPDSRCEKKNPLAQLFSMTLLPLLFFSL